MERSPLFCATCDVDLTLGDVVFAIARSDGRAPQFVHPDCWPPKVRPMHGSQRLGPGPVRQFVLDHVRDRSRRREIARTRPAYGA
jgi:hypothetical protein